MYNDEMVKQLFAKRLKGLREAAGLSQGELADELRVSRGSISYYETQQRVPDIVFLQRVSDYFGVGVNFLLGHSYNQNPQFEEYGLFLGLSDDAIKKLCDSDCGHELSAILEHNNFDMLADCVSYFFLPPFSDSNNPDPGLPWEWEYEYKTFEFTRILLSILTDIKSELAAEFYSRFSELFQDGDLLKTEFLKKEAAHRQKALEYKKQRDEEKKRKAMELLEKEKLTALSHDPLTSSELTPQSESDYFKSKKERYDAICKYIAAESAKHGDNGNGND